MKKIAINGFGRIGRLVCRNLISNPSVQIVAINDLTDAHTLAHLLKYDSVHKKLANKIGAEDSAIRIDQTTIPIFSERDPSNLPWKELGVDIVIESTGVFRDKAGLEKHIEAGAKKVILSAPAKGGDIPTIVLGVNDHLLSDEMNIVSNASCTTNCLAPMVHVLHTHFGVENGFINTIHAYTADQRLHDAPHSDLRRARAAALSMIPTTTGAAAAVGLVLPEMKGKLDGKAVRVPVPSGSLTDFTCTLSQKVSREDINQVMKEASNGTLKGILEYSEEELVSIDIVSNQHSCIFDSKLTMVHDQLVKVIGWYDNEAGYAARIADLVMKV